MKPFLASTFLDSHRLLERYFLDSLADDAKKVEELLFVELHAKDPYKPDYIFKNVMQDFSKDKSIKNLTIDSLSELSNMLEFREERVYVKNEYFERWQNIILSVSPLLIISYLIYNRSQKSFRVDIKSIIKSAFNKSALPSIYEPKLDYMIANGGLNETHMHLTGSTEADIVWHDALSNPTKFYAYLGKSIRKQEVTEQYLQIGNITQQDLFRLLTIAAQLRDSMIQLLYIDDYECDDSFTKHGYEHGKTLYYASKVHPLSQIEKDCLNSPMQYEALFFIKAFEYLQSTQSSRFANLFHYYLLIYSFFQKILVQQKMQVGFDQFQKITLNELRELTEEKYKNRYLQLQGMYDNSLCVLEGRFSPKDSLKKSAKLLKSISKGYDKTIQKDFELKLVPHFVKLPDNRNPDKIITFRDLKLRLELRKKLEVLFATIKRKEYKKLIVGFDAAANELHASPEVFSPIFRKLRFLGHSNFTYHAGEDFIHIISGLRIVYEAVEFLDMRSGNRIGHATALGISPELWIQRLYESKLTIKQGEWLDNLAFAYMLFKDNAKYFGYLNKLEDEIRKYFAKIYALNKHAPIHNIIEAWKSRKYDPFIALKWREPSILEEFEQIELREFCKLDKDTREIYEEYHTSKTIKEYNKMIQISPDESPFDAHILRDLQNMMIEFVNSKNIALETLPTSNMRISFYKEYKEHHLWRWLGYDEKFKDGDPKPTVVVGSDDTGIFMTNLRNEYAHIFQTLAKITDSQTALSVITELSLNSKAYTFK